MLRLNHITISEFRGIREGEVAGFGDVSIVVGPNNAGKSTVAEAIVRLAAGVTGNLLDVIGRDRVQHYCNHRNERQPLDDAVFFNYARSTGFKLDGQVGEGRIAYGFREGVNAPGGPSPAVCGDFLNRIASFLPRDAFDSQIEAASWNRMVQSSQDLVLTGMVNDMFGMNARDVMFTPDARLLFRFHDPKLPPLSMGAQGSGVQAALRCLILFSALERTMFIIEEPENHLHFRALGSFARSLCKTAKEREVQLFITSHSIEAVQAFIAGATEAGSEAVVFHLSLDGGVLKAAHLDIEAVRALERLGTDVRDLQRYA